MTKTIYVGNLPWSFSTADLTALFQEYGPVKSAQIMYDRDSGKSRGFGFVQLQWDHDADRAIQTLHGQDVGRRTVVVNFHHEGGEENGFHGPGPRLGGYGAGGYGGGYGPGQGYGPKQGAQPEFGH